MIEIYIFSYTSYICAPLLFRKQKLDVGAITTVRSGSFVLWINIVWTDYSVKMEKLREEDDFDWLITEKITNVNDIQAF